MNSAAYISTIKNITDRKRCAVLIPRTLADAEALEQEGHWLLEPTFGVARIVGMDHPPLGGKVYANRREQMVRSCAYGAQHPDGGCVLVLYPERTHTALVNVWDKMLDDGAQHTPTVLVTAHPYFMDHHDFASCILYAASEPPVLLSNIRPDMHSVLTAGELLSAATRWENGFLQVK